MLTLALRVKPGASRTKVGGRHDGPYGPALVVAVNAPAVDGRATEAALRAVAEALGIKRRHLRVTAGHASRDKLVTIESAGGVGGAGRDATAGGVGGAGRDATAGGVGGAGRGADPGASLVDRIVALRDAGSRPSPDPPYAS